MLIPEAILSDVCAGNGEVLAALCYYGEARPGGELVVLLARLDSYNGNEDDTREVLKPRTPSTLGLSPSVFTFFLFSPLCFRRLGLQGRQMSWVMASV